MIKSETETKSRIEPHTSAFDRYNSFLASDFNSELQTITMTTTQFIVVCLLLLLVCTIFLSSVKLYAINKAHCVRETGSGDLVTVKSRAQDKYSRRSNRQYNPLPTLTSGAGAQCKHRYEIHNVIKGILFAVYSSSKQRPVLTGDRARDSDQELHSWTELGHEDLKPFQTITM